ncbi:protein MIX23-like [Oppia nitens]|uniref:protein MIX23-like n=1 Tax=Oppia nitens TaxID=1686743 RepID=UPI0023D9D928|nr:protein MIX23-like [Oppia nitens]
MDNTCEDFLAFEEALKKSRKIDDNIIHLLNTSIPTDSFAVGSTNAGKQCQELYQQLQTSYSQREKSIKHCISVVSDRVKSIKSQRQQNEDDMDVLKSLRKEQTKLRLMQNELNVEEVVRDRTVKVFYDRCRSFYKPKDMKI